MSDTATMDLRTIANSRRFTTLAVIEPRRGRGPLRTEVVKNNKADSCFCRACKRESCRHIDAARRLLSRAHLSIVAPLPSSAPKDQT